MNDKYEFQVGDLVRLKSVEEILALGFSFNERGEIAYPKSKTVLLLTSELKHCGDEFVVDDFTEIGRIDLKSPNSVERIVNICPSVLELVEVEEVEEEEKAMFKPFDRVRIKQVDELLELGYTIDAYGYLRYPNYCVFLHKHQMCYCGQEFTVVDHEVAGIYVIESLDRETLFDFVLESALELIEYEEQLPTLKVGDKVRIKTHEELLASGWVLEENGGRYFNERVITESIVGDMLDFFGEVCTVKERLFNGDFLLKEDESCWIWTSHMVAEVITDEEGNPFDPNADYIEEEEYQPYCAVVDDTPVSNNTYKPTTWDKERIQRGFENLEMYVKGYDDGFQRALELMKKEFGVE